jgi:aflatoxin B1 aldehyde reductase
MYRARYFQDSTFNALQLIEPVVQKHNLTLLETALRWVVHHSKLNVFAKDGGNDGIIIGVSSLKQLEGNIADLEKGPLPEEVLKVLDQAWDSIKYQGPSYWR